MTPEISGTLIPVTPKQPHLADDSDVQRDADTDAECDARIARDALDRLERARLAAESELRDNHARARQVQRLGKFLAGLALVPLVIMLLPLQIDWVRSGQSTLLMYASLACAIGAVLCTGAAVAMRSPRLRERREAIRAKRAGLCTCNYPRPPGMFKCPECGGDMVMK